MRSFLAALACVFSPIALAAPPAAPVVSVGASDIKQLQFDWPSVPGVATYELWFRAAPGAQWVKYAETPAQRPLIRINVSVHLLDWRVARYRVAACNPSGCTNSAEVGVDDLAHDAVGYLKPNYAGEAWSFGADVAMSADGKTAAVSFSLLPYGKGGLYVYRKPTSSGPWRFEARLIPAIFGGGGAGKLAVNGDGTLIAYGRPTEGVGGESFNGTVHLYRRNGTTWTMEQRLVAGGPAFDRFGNELALDDTGTTLAVWRRGADRWSATYGITDIYRHGSAGWQLTATIPLPPSANGYAPRCDHLALSGNGQKLLRTCWADSRPVALVHDAPGWSESARIPAGDDSAIATNYDGTLFATLRSEHARADVYRLQQGVWGPDSGSPFDFSNGSTTVLPFLTSVAMSRDGKFIAIGDYEDQNGLPGPNYPPIPQDDAGAPGGVYVFERKSAGWTLRRLMKPSVTTRSGFGYSVALGADGKNMILGASTDKSPATGINGDQTQSSGEQIGAAWLY